MRRYLGFVAVAAALVAASAAVYTLHYSLFHDAHHIWIYLVGDIAFVPLEVLLVAIVIERLLARHERERRLHRLNMVVGTFFSELGTRLLGDLARALEGAAEVREGLSVAAAWKPADYRRALGALARRNLEIDPARLDLAGLKALLAGKRDLLVMLLSSPNLLEHERFTNLLWAVSHLREELAARTSLEGLPESDLRHLAGDAQRVVKLLAAEWVRYCRHLQKSYPYIFSVVVRTHPLQEHPSATVT